MKRTFFCITILSVCMSCSVTFGIAPISEPATNLEKGWWRLGADYSSTKMDLDLENIENLPFYCSEKLDMELLITGKYLLDLVRQKQISVILSNKFILGAIPVKLGQMTIMWMVILALPLR